VKTEIKEKEKIDKIDDCYVKRTLRMTAVN